MPGGKRNKKFHHHQKKKPWKNQRKKEQQQGEGDTKQSRRADESSSNDFILATITKGNYKFEAYYAAQGLHNHRYNKDDDENENGNDPPLLHSNTTLEEWQAERLAWRTALGSILPASFRFNGMLSSSVKHTMHQELMQLVRQARDWKPSSTQPKEKEEDADDKPNQDDDDEEEKQDTLEDPQQQQQQQQDTTAANTNTTTAPTPLPPPEMDGTTNETNNNNDTTVADPSTTTTTTPPPVMVDWQPLTEDDTHLTRIPFVTDPWGLAYQWSVLDRNQLRKHPALQPIKEWLVQKTSSGQVTRQETVSMIPPIVLLSQLLVQQQQEQQQQQQQEQQEEPPHKTPSRRKNNIGLTVLDLCAAPGSKTSQLVEGMSQLHGRMTTTTTTTSSTTTTTSHGWPEQAGVLVANDVNPNRANMLTHQLKRVLHQFPVAVVTAAPAQFLSFGGDSQSQQTFDAILADVPCSGDGTTRKNIQVWNTWSQMGALSLHPLQLDIAWQGLSSLLSNDGNGILCYSTCSMNPMENEAVVAELLRRGQGAVEVVECRPVVHGSTTTTNSDGFPTRPGWSTWKVLCEPMSRKQMKHRDNKHKANMQEKRQQHHEAQAQAQQDSSSSKSTTNNNDQDDSLSAASAAPHQPPGDGHEHERNVALAAQPYSPTSMDPCYLMELATHVAGYRHFTSMDQVHEAGLHQRIRPSCFPPTEAWIQDQLKRCIRCLPHDNNTGGFFVALLHKKGPIPNANKKEVDKKDVDKKNDDDDDDDKNDKESNEAETKSDSPPKEPPIKRAKTEGDAPENPEPIKDAVDTTTSTTATKEQNPEGGKKRRRNDHQQNQRQVFVPVKDELLEPLIEYYGFGGPGFRKDLFMARSNSECKVIYFLAPSVKDFLFPPTSGSNTSSSVCDSVNVIATGLKAFCKNNSIKECPISHRIAQEAAHFLAPYMSDRRKFTVGRSDFQACLRPPHEGKGAAIPLDENFSTEFVQHVRGLDVGAFVVVLEQEQETTDSMVLVLWRCRGDHINTLVSAVEVDAIQSKLAAQTPHGNSAGATTTTKTAATTPNTSGLQQEQQQDMSTEMK